MKTLFYTFTLIGLLLFTSQAVQSQYVTIPDTAFVNWLDTNGFHQCLNRNQLDTTCPEVVNRKTIDLSRTASGLYTPQDIFYDLEGIQYFDALDTLICSGELFETLPRLPASLRYLNCQDCRLTDLPILPAGLTYLNFSVNPLTHFPDSLPTHLNTLSCYEYGLITMAAWPTGLTTLYCGHNQVLTISNLPNALENLYCSGNGELNITSFPSELKYINISGNNLASLPQLPDSLIELICHGNKLTALPVLPSKLEFLWCCYNPLYSLPTLPASLRTLLCNQDSLANLPELPDSLEVLDCDGNQITSLPVLPSQLKTLWTFNNPLSGLPTLPTGLTELNCYNNQLANLPVLPRKLSNLDCRDNHLTSLPMLPDTMRTLDCSGNPDLRCIPYFKRIQVLEFDTATVLCVENYGAVYSGYAALHSKPLCSSLPVNSCSALSTVNDVNETFGISIAPNPAASYFTIQTETEQSELITFQLFDITGRILLQQALTQQTTRVDISTVSGGMYLYNVLGAKERLGAGKVVVE